MSNETEFRPTITVAHPLPQFKKMRVSDMLPGTVFVNSYHSPATIMGGGDKFSIYMKIQARNSECGDAFARGRDHWNLPLVVNLRNGNAYNLQTKKNAPVEGYVMTAEFVCRLLG